MDEEKLRKASGHVYYEAWMLVKSAELILPVPPPPTVQNNALLESFAVHFRNLWDFICVNRKTSDDVVVGDYLIDADKVDELRSSVPSFLTEYHTHVHKMIAHLSYKRVRYTTEEYRWPFVDIANEMRRVMDHFQKVVSKSLLGPEWKGGTSTFDD
jgi:hypothetical protein